MDWPPVREQVDRMEEALEIIGRLFDGERLDYDGRFFRTKRALLHTRAERRPPIYVSAFGPRAARIAARLSDGLWTLGDPEMAPDVIDVYKGACEDAGKDPGEIILQAGFSWAQDDDTALEGARVWKSAQQPEFFRDDWSDPQSMYRHAEDQMSDEEFKQAFIVSSDPDHHVERVREIEQLGATIVCLQNTSGADPLGALSVYGEQVLPALRGARAG
nr:LLM class flavin-dependent oxidoreductase [Thermoleophilaceae bacterium]